MVSSVFAPTERMVFSKLSATWSQARLFKIEFMAGEGNAGEAAAIFEKRISGICRTKLSPRRRLEKGASKTWSYAKCICSWWFFCSWPWPRRTIFGLLFFALRT